MTSCARKENPKPLLPSQHAVKPHPTFEALRENHHILQTMKIAILWRRMNRTVMYPYSNLSRNYTSQLAFCHTRFSNALCQTTASPHFVCPNYSKSFMLRYMSCPNLL